MTISPAALYRQLRSPRSIIVLAGEHPDALVCATPALRSLRQLYPDAHIVIEVGERVVCILQNNPDVDEIILRPSHQGLSGKAAFIRLLRSRRFDLGIILDCRVEMRLYLWMGAVIRRVGLVQNKRFAEMLTDQVEYDSDADGTEDNFRRVIAHLGGDVSDL
jgi:ADP-heptose:LPS heptosyltransferase